MADQDETLIEETETTGTEDTGTEDTDTTDEETSGSESGEEIDYSEKFDDISDKLKDIADSLSGQENTDYSEKLESISKTVEELSKLLFVKHDAKPATVKVSPNDVKKFLGKCTPAYFMKNKKGSMDGRVVNYDLDGDGIITEKDVKLAEEGQAKPEYIETLIDALQTIASQLKSSTQKNIYEEKDLYIKHVAAEIFAYSDFDRYNVNNLLNRAVQNATLLANKFNW